MAKLRLMRNSDEFMRYRLLVWNRDVGIGKPPSFGPNKFPCLIEVIPVTYSFRPGATGMLITTCTKNEAKRIIYPKTNKGRSRFGFTIIEGENLMAAMEAFIKRSIERSTMNDHGIDVTSPEQLRLIDEAVSSFEGVSGLALAVAKVYNNLDSLRLVNFYTVDESDAHKLVYCNKNRPHGGFKPHVIAANVAPNRRRAPDVEFDQFVRAYNKIWYGSDNPMNDTE